MKFSIFVSGIIALLVSQLSLQANSMPSIINDSSDIHIQAWINQYGSSSDESGESVTTDSSGNIYITGYTWGKSGSNTSSVETDIFLTKFSSGGTKLWTEQYGSSNDDRGQSVTTDSSGNIYITGYTEGEIGGNTSSWGTDIFLTKFSSDGTKLWTKQSGSSSDDKGLSVATDIIGNLYIAGYTWGDLDGNSNSGGYDIFLSKYQPYKKIMINHHAGNTAVIDIDAIDNDNYVLSYNIINGRDSGSFTIDNATGELSFKTSPYINNPLDENYDNIYEVGIIVNDGNGGRDDLFLLITVIGFEGDGKVNLLWHKKSTGAIKIIPINSMLPKDSISVATSSNTNLLPKGIGDFTGDGKPDILFHNQNSGNLRIWEMNGTTKVNNIQVLGSSNTNLKIAGVGDFNGDGNNDIAVFNINSGALRMWVMKGVTRVDNVLVLSGTNTNLVPRGVGDMDNDGIPDIVLRNNNSGAVRVWTMNADLTRKGNEYVTSSSNTNLKLRGVMDMNGDGNNDILNYNTNTGKLRAWLLAGRLKLTENAELVQAPDLDWRGRGGSDSFSFKAPPIANAGVDQNVNTIERIMLDGSGSFDALTYYWKIVFKPVGSTATLSNNTLARPTFLADRKGYYVIELIVDNGMVSSAFDRIVIVQTNDTMKNTAPVAEAGANQAVRTGATVTLDGTGSLDADRDELTWIWSFMSKPSGSNAKLDDSTSSHPSFVADMNGTYVIQLVVHDGTDYSEAATVTITASLLQLIIYPLGRGMSGQDVATLHQALQFLLEKNILVSEDERFEAEVHDNTYGVATAELIRQFQEKYQLASSGEVDAQTAQTLNSILQEFGT
jgi:hypothetical protein